MSDQNNNFRVAVVATMSSGKSTTLNALLGMPLLPSKNEACTAIVTCIEDIDGLDTILARPICKDGHPHNWNTIDSGNLSLLRQWNCADNKVIEIQGDFPHIDNHHRRMEFIDTPGPNNSMDVSHAEITHGIIDDSGHSVIVFVMNATQFGVDDERRLLIRLCDTLKKEKKQACIIFAVNKIDQLDIDAGEAPSDMLLKIDAYLKEIGFENPDIIPLMSLLSLEIRMCLTSHKKGTPLPFSNRTQKRIVMSINGLCTHADAYIRGLLYSHHNEIYLARAYEQSRGIDMAGSIRIGETDLPVSLLIEADILSGIPCLEEMLELEMMRDEWAAFSLEELIVRGIASGTPFFEERLEAEMIQAKEESSPEFLPVLSCPKDGEVSATNEPNKPYPKKGCLYKKKERKKKKNRSKTKKSCVCKKRKKNKRR